MRVSNETRDRSNGEPRESLIDTVYAELYFTFQAYSLAHVSLFPISVVLYIDCVIYIGRDLQCF